MPIPGDVFQNVLGTPATPSFFEWVLRGHAVESDGSSQRFFNILHFARLAGPGTASELNVGDAIMAALTIDLSAALSVAYVADDYTGRFMDDPTHAAVIGANTLVGAITGDRLPSFNAVVTRKKTVGRGRSFKGSNHWGPIAESDTTLDTLNVGAATRWGAVVTSLQTISTPFVVGSDTWQLIVLSQVLSNLTANPSLFSGATVQANLLNGTIGTMRRRKMNVGI